MLVICAQITHAAATLREALQCCVLGLQQLMNHHLRVQLFACISSVHNKCH